jgi:hypothetical protein
MATLAKYNSQTAIPASGLNKVFLIENTVNLAAVATGDVVQALRVAADTYVQQVFVEVVTASGLTSTATVGDGDDADGYDASTNLNATAGTITYGAGGTDAYLTANGKLYTAADTIDLTCTITSGPIVAGSIKIRALCVDVS